VNKNTMIDYRNPMMVRNAGVSALKKELGIVGTVYFLRQFNVGKGDYTAERDNLLREASPEEIVEGIWAMQSMTNTKS